MTCQHSRICIYVIIGIIGVDIFFKSLPIEKYLEPLLQNSLTKVSKQCSSSGGEETRKGDLYVSQAIAGIGHFRKCLVISGNA
jgi:hypothetical protein